MYIGCLGANLLLGYAAVQVLLLSFGVSLIATLFILRFSYLHERFSGDHDLVGVQKFHAIPVPRVGGISIVLGLSAVAGFLGLWRHHPASLSFMWLLVSATPAFFGGFIEDLTKRVGVLPRLLLTMVAAALAIYLIDAKLGRLDIIGFDVLMRVSVLSVLFTLVAVAGVANSINLIDGYNGLAAVVAVVMALALGYVAYLVGDLLVWNASLALTGALLGFVVWNYPRGLIFLGDGGAYLVGFWLAELSVLLVSRNPSVSAWFPLLVMIYPIVETLFSIWRRIWLHGRSPGIPDAAHLHQLIYKRLVRWAVGSRHIRHRTVRNAMTSPYLWALSSLGVLPAVLFWQHTLVLQGVAISFAIAYIWLYRRIVRFNVPRWMVLRHKVEHEAGAVRQSKV